MSKTHYEILGVNELAGGAKIKRHYYELCKKYHPDVGGGDANKMISINEAYRVLSDATLKSAYDRNLVAQRRETASSAAPATATTSQAAWRHTAPKPAAANSAAAFPRAAGPHKKQTGWAWFMAVGGVAAVIIITVSYLAPFPKAANVTDTPVATADTSQTSTPDTAPSTPSPDVTSQSTDSTASAANPAPADSADTPPSTTNVSDTTTVSQSQTQTQPTTTHKHRRLVFPFWYTQNND